MEDRFIGNDEPDNATVLATGVLNDLSLCTESDWYTFVVADAPGNPRSGIRLTLTALADEGNLEMALFEEDFRPGQRPLIEATTNQRPETLITNDLAPGRYILQVYSWSPAGQAPEPQAYTLTYEESATGFCSDVIACEEAMSVMRVAVWRSSIPRGR